MATQETGAVIVFDDGHEMHTRDTREKIVNGIRGVGTPHVPLIEVELPAGDHATVNAAQIRLIRDAPSAPSAEDYGIEQL